MLVNWKVEYTKEIPTDKQPPDYVAEGKPYWFFRYFEDGSGKEYQVDVVDIRSFPLLERFEKNCLRFYIWQTLRVLPRLKQYDLVLSHGMQSGIVLCLWRRLFGKGNYRHIVFDIGAFNSARESGKSLKLMQFASRTLDGVIYHTALQKAYYEKCHPWLVNKSRYVPFGTDADFFLRENALRHNSKRAEKPYIISIGYNKRDWKTLLDAYDKLDTEVELYLLGNSEWTSRNTKVKIFPPVSILEMINMIENSLFGVLPLKWFNYSYGQMTLMQQMALGKAVIVSEVPSVKDYVENNVNALFYQPENVDELTKQMKRLLNDSELREKIGQCASETIKTRMNEEMMAIKIKEYVDSVYAGTNRI